jgi:tRNA dimethylallyltransferase
MKQEFTKQSAIIVAGPTAVGKSDYAVEIAERYGGEIVSADSIQIYKGLNIGAAKPSQDMLARVPHHLIDVAEPSCGFSVAEYREHAAHTIRSIFERNKTPVIAGGTGLYIHSLLYEMDFSGAGRDDVLRAKYESEAEHFGNESIYAILKEKDPQAAERIHPNNRRRVIRALERIERGTAPDGLKAFTQAQTPTDFFTPVFLLLTRDREELYYRIEMRVDAFIDAGLVDEVRGLRESGLSREHISMLGIGYKELLDCLEGAYDLDQAIYLIKLHTRRYAKRQLTWFSRYEGVHVFNLSAYADKESVLRAIFRITDAHIKGDATDGEQTCIGDDR